MSKDETNTHLKFGQGILIQGYKDVNADLGLLTSKGFADTKVNYQTYNDILYFKNYRNAIFQILPSANFEINDELRKIKAKDNADPKNLEILQKRALSETEQFELGISNKNKELVCFGNTVIFKHIDSGTYLSGTISPSEGSNGAFTVEVSSNFSQALVFRLQPFRSFQSEGMPIPFDSPIKIRNQFNGGYLTFEKLNSGRNQVKENNLFQSKVFQQDLSYKITVKDQSQQSQEYECVTYFVDLSVEKQVPMPWKFVLHVNEVENDSLIQHDIVYLQHTENQGVLSASKTKIILKELKGEKSSQLSFYQCLWEIQKHQGKDAYILRHLMSGMTLGVYRQDGQPKYPILIDITKGAKEGNIGYIELKEAKKQNKPINSDSFVNVCWQNYCIDIKPTGTEVEPVHTLGLQRQDPRLNKERLKQLALNEIQYVQREVIFTRDISKHCFMIMEIDNDLKKQLLFALSFHSRIIKLQNDLKYGEKEATKKVSYLRMMQVAEKIMQIKYFLKKNSTQEAKYDYIQPVEKRQKICKDLGISELIFQLLYYMKANEKESIFKENHNEKAKFIQLYNICYEVIIELIRNNFLFKVHVSKWVLFIIDDVIQSDEQCRLKTLKELLKDNPFLVNNFITEELVKDLASKMIDVPVQKRGQVFNEIKFLEIFRSFCIVGESMNTDNQISILNHFLKLLKTPNGSIYAINIKKEGDTILVQANIQKNNGSSVWRSFSDFYKVCKQNSASLAWQYFISFMNLMADMTKGRNKTVEKVMEVLFPFDVLADLLKNEQLYEAEVPIIRLVHYLYVQNQKYYPIEVQRNIINYKSIDNEVIELNSTTAIEKPWDDQQMSAIVKTMLTKIKNYKQINPKNYNQNMCLFQILNLFLQTLNLGFYNELQGLKNLLNDILAILVPPKFNQDQSQSYATYSRKSKDNILMIKCKMQCLKIIKTIIDYDVDLSVKHIGALFKNFQFPLKKPHLSKVKGKEQQVDMSFAYQFIQQIDQKNMVPILDSSICEQMIQLSKYNSPELTSESLEIIKKVTRYKSQVIDNFAKQVFIYGEDRIKLAKYISERKNKFFLLSDPNTIKCNHQNQESNYFYIQNQSFDKDKTGIMQDMYTICELMKNQNSIGKIQEINTIHTSGLFKQLASEKLINFTLERASSNDMKQKVIDASNIHRKVLVYILNCTQFPEEELALKLLHLCYRFLVSLIQNYQAMKVELIPQLPKMRHHLARNLGCIDFMKEIYDNNKNMLYNQQDIIQVTKQICSIIQTLDIDESFYKSKLLDFFRYLIFCNEKALKTNQILILKIMQDDDYTRIFIQDCPDFIRDSNKFIENLVLQYEESYRFAVQSGSNVVKRSPRLAYTETFFQIMGSLIDGNNKVNIGKLVKRFPFDTLVNYIKIANNCWALKRNIRALLNRLYYFQPNIEVYLKTIIGTELDNIINDLDLFIGVKVKKEASYYEGQIYQNPVRFSYLQSYFYLNLQQNLLTLYQFATRRRFEEEIRKYFATSKQIERHYSFIKICERLGCIKNYFTQQKNIYTSSLIKYLLAKFKAILNEFNIDIYSKAMNNKQKKEEQKKNIIQTIIIGQISQFYKSAKQEYKGMLPLSYLKKNNPIKLQSQRELSRQGLITSLRKILMREKRQFENQDEEIKYKMQKLISGIKLYPKIKIYYQQSYEQSISSYYVSHSKNVFQYIGMIIQMNETNSEALSPQLKIFFLQMITSMVQQANKTQMPERKQIDTWETKEWCEYEGQIQSLQRQLNQKGLGKYLTELLKQNIENNFEFANAVLLCCIAFLFGGYSENQKNIIENMKTQDQDNKVMKNLQALVAKLGGIILKNISELGVIEVESDIFSVSTIDNYDYYDVNTKYCLRKNVFQPNSTNQNLYRELCIITYRRSFKFLQLLCQNNNIDGKNFIREQPQKHKKVNFINIATKQLRNLFEAMRIEIADVPLYLIDFILEVTQIPVAANQQALMTSTFFEDLCQMESNFSKPEQLALRNFENREPLQEIYFKAVQIILSNFEGNELSTFKLLDSKLQSRFLINILGQRLKKINVSKKAQLLLYIEKAAQQIDQNGQKIAKTTFDDDMMSILSIITIFMKMKQKFEEPTEDKQLENYESKILRAYEKSKKDNQKLYQYLESCLLSIEITDNNGKNQIIFFPKFPVFNSLSAGLRDYVMSMVQRSTHRDKIISLLSYIPDIKDAINTSYKLEKAEGISQVNLRNSYNYASAISVFICLFMMIYYDVIIEYGEVEFASKNTIGLIRFLVSLVHVFFSLQYLYYWFRLKIWYSPTAKSREPKEPPPLKQQKPAEQIDVPVQQPAEPPKFSLLTLPAYLLHLWGRKTQFFDYLGISTSQEEEQKVYTTGSFYKIIFYVLISFLGTFYQPSFFFIHIIDIFTGRPELANIFQAIGDSKYILFLLSVMATIFTLVFCTVTFSNYMKNVYSDQDSIDDLCDNMLSCVMKLYVSGAIGESMEQFEIVRFVYDSIYITFFGLLFGNIVSGILIDAFTVLRQSNDQLKLDKQNTCYICNVQRENVEQKGQSFPKHIKNHFLWNYEKSSTDFTGLQYAISTKYDKPDEDIDVSWIPSGEQKSFDSLEKIQALKQTVSSTLQEINQKIQVLDANIEEFNNTSDKFAQ